MGLNPKLKKFIFSGFIGIGVLILYELLIILSSGFLNLFALILAWWPLYLPAMISSNLYVILILTILEFFILGGVIGLIHQSIKERKS